MRKVYFCGNLDKLLKIFLFLVLITIPLLNLTLHFNQFNKNSSIRQYCSNIHSSRSEYHKNQWFKNTSFENSTEYWTSRSEGDTTDVNLSICDGCANFELLGEQRRYSLVSDPPSNSTWTEVVNPNYPNLPDVAEVTEDGCIISHEFNDITAVQDPCVHWDQNLTLPINISDYQITSASIQAIVNATVDKNLDTYYDYIYSRYARTNPNDRVDTYSIGDYVRFYVLISDLDKKNIYEIAYFQTEMIGDGSPPGKDYLYDSNMTSVPEENLIFYLTSVLGDHNSKFTITLGIRLHIEDNLASNWDLDTFDQLLIKSVNLTFTYDKKINQMTSLYMNQIGASINGNNIEIISANLNFKYKIDPYWVSSLTHHSEMKVLINNYDSGLHINLNRINSSFQYLKDGGIDLTSLILRDTNISLTISLNIGDNFVLDRLIKISVDDINFEIYYSVEIKDSPPPNYFIPFILILSISLILVFGSLSFKAYVLIPRKNKKFASLILKTQKMKDIENIQAVMLVQKASGLPLITQSYSKILKGKDALFSGFIQAITLIGEEITRDNPSKAKYIKLHENRVIELDLKNFFCLISDVDELRSVLILKKKSSKRLKEKLFQFTLELNLKFCDQLQNRSNNLTLFNQIAPKIINEYFELYYKNYFKSCVSGNNLNSIKKEYKLTRLESHLFSQIQKMSEERELFRLKEILDLNHDKNEDTIIFTLESLIQKNIITPSNS